MDVRERSTVDSGSKKTVDVVIPVYNEEAQIVGSLNRLRSYLEAHLPEEWTITVANNASTDQTLKLATEYAEKCASIRILHLDKKGRGRALKSAWLSSEAHIVAYMDVDLSTNLKFFLPLVRPLIDGTADISIGTRLDQNSIVTRQIKREVISRVYNGLIGLLFDRQFSDAQCGFKALTSEIAANLIPNVKDNSWFFDTELLILAEESKLRINEVPVEWIEDLDSRVNLVTTGFDDVRGLVRLRKDRRSRRALGRMEADEIY